VSAAFLKTTHGQLGCTTCHAGQPQTVDVKVAHTGLVQRPSAQPEKFCGSCHQEIAGKFSKTLHFTARGMGNGLKALVGTVRWAPSQKPFKAACASCHATCGDCHVSRPPFRPSPPTILGGFQNGHQFAKTPQMEQTCAGCHSGRVAAEFTGTYEGFPADVHFTKAKMTCTSCHSTAQMHGDGSAPPNRRANKAKPACTDCHPDAASGKSRLQAHNIHGDKLQCAVCHGGISRSCDNCHAGEGAQSRPALKIGRNIDPNIPNAYTLMRHIPTTPDMIDRLTGLQNTLVNFDKVPTWKPNTPHNIQRVTVRSRTCEGCHNNPNLFLRLQDLNPRDSQANGRVVTAPPRPIPPRSR
jgi:thiosulfate/3-mercaptopyruvate sulfurtransferase